MNDPSRERPKAGIAIVGLAGRFPAAPTIQDFWRNLTQGVEAIHFASDDELASAGIPDELVSNPDFVRASSTVHEPEFFDAAFFGFSAREAEIIDPQQRVFLECAWEALEDAACDPASFSGAIGLFAGAGMNTYAMVNLLSNPELIQSVGAYQAMIGNDKDFLCSRVSYKLNLRGPSVGVQTACSTSLVAVQMAFESLRRGECDVALAGGVSIALPQPAGYLYVPGMILSKDGHCRAFDASASGTVPGAGAGVVALKRLDDALADGDHIYAVIRGAAINNDGSAKVGYTAPSVDGQTAVIRRSMEMAGFEPASIAYVEAHGTGTEVGDPIEVTALSRAFDSAPQGSRSCALGALKTNIGHLDAAAGVAGLIKATLAVHRRTIPPTLHFKAANPLIDFASTPFYVNGSVVSYDRPQPFRVGVSSFGIGGTNAHVSIEEAPTEGKSEEGSDSAQLFVLSARSATALDRQTERLLTFLEANPDAKLADVAFTLQVGRSAFNHRRVMVARDVAQLKDGLQPNHLLSAAQRQLRVDPAPAEAASVVFMFSGQGSQYVNMGRGLYETAPVFREIVDRCSEILEPHLALNLRSLLYPPAGEEAEAERRLGQTAITQPALFVIEYAMAQLWIDCGVRPSAMLGHSIGEYVAACVAGVFSLEDALTLVAARGAMIQAAPPGTMLAVSLPEQDLEPLLTPDLSIAVINGPLQTVASGPDAAIDALEAALRSRKIERKRLRTSHAFHSSMMDGVVRRFIERVAKTPLHAPKLRYLSNVTGDWITERQATDPEYWGSHLRQAVRFGDGVHRLLREPQAVLVEVGPGDALLSLARMQPEARGRTLIPSTRHRLSKEDDRDVWLKSLGRLWLLRTRINWTGLHRGEHRHRLSLPTYPFERQRYWVEPKQPAAQPAPSATLEKKPEIADWFYVRSWKRSVAELLPPSKVEESDTWLLLADDGELADAIALGLAGHGHLVRVRTAAAFRQVSRELYEVDPENREDFSRLIAGLTADGLRPDRIVHAWIPSTSRKEDPNTLLDRGVLSAMSLVQTMEDASSPRRIEFNVIGDRAYSISGEPVSEPATLSLNVFTDVVAAEYPNVICRRIDLDLRFGTDEAVARLVHEVLSAAANETIAYRGSARWVEQFEPVRLEKPGRDEFARPSSIALKSDGIYLITGGLGGVGLVFARHLAKAVNARIILTSRTPLPPTSAWEAILLAPDSPDALKRRIEGVRSIEQAGGTVDVLAGDVADREAMRQMLSRIRAQYGAIHGIIHAAGVADSGLIQTKSREQVKAVLSPKVEGTEWIKEAIGMPDAAQKLDFVLLCSSISAVVPSYGLSDYAAANAYLDAFAAIHDDPRGTRVISANFDTWREVGMAVDTQLPEAMARLREDRLKHGILSSEAVEVFDRLLEWPMSQIVVSTRDFNQLRRQTFEAIATMGALILSPGDGEGLQVSGMSEPSDVFSIQDQAGEGDEIQRFITEVWQDLLGVKAIGSDDNFFELGGHSLLGTQVLARIRGRYRIDISLRTIFEAVTPAELAQRVRLALWSAASPRADVSALEREEIEI